MSRDGQMFFELLNLISRDDQMFFELLNLISCDDQLKNARLLLLIALNFTRWFKYDRNKL
jgi:hypothetical protein